MIDLNTLIPNNSSLLLLDASYINDRGEIAGHGLTLNGENHAFLLIPCSADQSDAKVCEDASENASAASVDAAPMGTSPMSTNRHKLTPESVGCFAWRWTGRYHIPSIGASERD